MKLSKQDTVGMTGVSLAQVHNRPWRKDKCLHCSPNGIGITPSPMMMKLYAGSFCATSRDQRLLSTKITIQPCGETKIVHGIGKKVGVCCLVLLGFVMEVCFLTGSAGSCLAKHGLSEDPPFNNLTDCLEFHVKIELESSRQILSKFSTSSCEAAQTIIEQTLTRHGQGTF